MTTKDASNKDTRELVPFSYRFNDDFDEDEKKKEKRKRKETDNNFQTFSGFFIRFDYMRNRFRMLGKLVCNF